MHQLNHLELFINGFVVEATVLPFETGGGILQILIPGEENKAIKFHHDLVDFFRKLKMAKMSKEELNEDGKSEIRLLERTILETIDLLRSHGYGITEKRPG